MTTDARSRRDQQTGELIWPLDMDVVLHGQLMPTLIRFRNWASVSAYLDGEDFAAISDRVDSVVIRSHVHD